MLDVNGNARFRAVSSGIFAFNLNLSSDGTLTTATSDISMKENITRISDAIDKVNKLRGVSFTWKDDPSQTIQIGMIAQEVEPIIPEIVFTNPVDGLKGINYSQATAILVEAIKEQQQQIESYKSQLQSLHEEVEQIKSLLASSGGK
jgi:histidyl-tRNA synthetase